MIRLRPLLVVSSMTVGLSLLTASCIGAGSSGEDAADVGTTEAAEPEESDQGVDETTTTATTQTTLPAVADLTDVAWVVNDFDGLIDDMGRTVAPPPPGVPDSVRPTVIRAIDGSIYYVLDGRLWRREIDASEPEEVETDVDEIFGVARAENGDITVNPFDNPVVLADAGAAVRPGSDSDEVSQITASNGVTVRVLPPDVDVDDLGYVTAFRSPARLEVERDGTTEWTIDAGGVSAPWLSLVDFDGRFVMLARSPTEPADPMLQHIVYDLDCPTGDATGGGCTRTFQARWGTAALVGPDREPGDDDLDTVLLDICPTMGRIVEPPAEMTDPGSFDEDFTNEDLEAFRLAALQLTTCDPNGLGDPEQPGLRYVPGSDDPDESGWMWTDFARALQGPFTAGQDGTFTWIRHENGPAGVLDRNYRPSRLILQPGRRSADHLAVTATPESMLVAGRTDPDTAEAVVAAIQSVATDRGVPLTDWIDTMGSAQPAALVDEFVMATETELVDDDQVGEIHLTADGVLRNLSNRTEPTVSERDLGFLMADFASGGEGVYDEVPLADDVLLALGSAVVARRQPTELFRRSAWAVNSSEFGGRSGPFNLLDYVPSPLQVVTGPHARCAGPEAVPSPPELASYTRIGILPLDGSIDSCLDWSAVDLFIDDEGVIRGLSLHLSEP